MNSSSRTVSDRFEGPLVGLNRLLQWTVHLVWLNAWWTLLTLLGGIVLGIGPATVAAHTVAAAWLRGRSDVSVPGLMWATWKRCWWPTTRATLIGTALVLSLVSAWHLSRSQGPVPAAVIQGLALVGLMVMAVVVVHLSWVIAHSPRLPVAHQFAAALAVGTGRPVLTGALLVLAVGWPVLLIMAGLPGLLPVGGASVPIAAGTWCVLKITVPRSGAQDERRISRTTTRENTPGLPLERI